jgi:hypothetical protein
MTTEVKNTLQLLAALPERLTHYQKGKVRTALECLAAHTFVDMFGTNPPHMAHMAPLTLEHLASEANKAAWQAQYEESDKVGFPHWSTSGAD